MRKDDELAKLEFKRLMLERLRIAAQVLVSNAMLADAELKFMADWMVDSLIVQLRTHVYAEQLEAVKKECKWPVDWWQAFKDRWFPRWMKRRWPVRWRVEQISIKRYASFPDNTNRWPKSLGPPVILTMDSQYGHELQE